MGIKCYFYGCFIGFFWLWLYRPIRNKRIEEKSIEEQFVDSARKGAVEKLRIYITNHNVDINTKDSLGDTALNVAAESGEIDAVKYLINQGARLNLKNIAGQDAKYFARIRGHKKILELLETSKE